MVINTFEALNFIRQTKIVPLTQTDGFISLIDLIVEENIKVSWWGYPKGKVIYNISQELEESNEILTIKLINGKITFVHKDIWTMLYRIVTDYDWREKRVENISDIARDLLDLVVKQKRVRFDNLKTSSYPQVKFEKRS